MSPDIDRTWENERVLRIGRSESLEIVLEDASLSRRHAEIEFSERGWVVRDLGSTNGTFLNGRRVGRADHLIRERDLLQCGNLVFNVETLTNELPSFADTACEGLEVQATARLSPEEAAELLVMDATRSTRPREQFLNLLRTGQCLDRIDSLDELLRRNLQNTITALGAKRGAIVLVDQNTGKLNLSAVCTTRPGLATGPQFSQTLATRCCRTSQSLLCANVLDDPELARATSVTGTPMSSIICALLRSPQKNLGVLHLDRGPRDTPFSADDLHLADAYAANMSAAIESAQLLQERQRTMFIQTIIAFSQAIEMRDEYTGGHTQRVTDYSLLLAQELQLSDTDMYHLRIGAPLHDIGKIGIDDAVLRKHERLTPEEYELMKSHTVKGAAILETIPDMEEVIPIVRNHHERWDGTGYPDRLAGDKIARLARLVAIADAFDAMTTDRPYRIGLTVEEAFAQIARGAGTQFDPVFVEAFLRLRPRIEHLVRQHQTLMHTEHVGRHFNVSKLMPNALGTKVEV
jgi:putative nucleotidyltransferase with HDIG domain